ncbi:MAG: hypothetical protein HY433_01490 [Candidatus Liptonbacteria bacterium]|nr:hypothetical protein [Candidatus Liptonbacteria bacterium]
MLIAIATTSILGITLLAHLANRILLPRLRSGQAFRICPICAGVSGTWIGLVIARFLGYPIDVAIPSLLMGGSVVGIAYQLEKKLPVDRSSLLWKTFFIPAGFIAAYAILMEWQGIFFAALIFLLLLSYLFLPPRKQQESQKKAVAVPIGSEPRPIGREELKKKMKDCC